MSRNSKNKKRDRYDQLSYINEEQKNVSMKRGDLALKNTNNRGYFYELASNQTGIARIDFILDQLTSYGIETSNDIAKLQGWQLRVLKTIFDEIDTIYIRAYQLFSSENNENNSNNNGNNKSEMMNDAEKKKKDLTRQFEDFALWLQYNEIELICQTFNRNDRCFHCFVCDTNHKIKDLDSLRWHLWVYHRNCKEISSLVF